MIDEQRRTELGDPVVAEALDLARRRPSLYL
jgi:hypothetical protein